MAFFLMLDLCVRYCSFLCTSGRILHHITGISLCFCRLRILYLWLRCILDNTTLSLRHAILREHWSVHSIFCLLLWNISCFIFCCWKKKKGFFLVQNIQLLLLFIFKALHVQVKKLEELGIGRPSTYASIMKVLQVIVLSWIFLNSLAYQRVIFVGIVA